MGTPGDGVGYVERNAIAGRSFASWEAFEAGACAILIAQAGEAHLAAWERDIANARVHGTTGEAPMIRFARDEAAALQPLADRPSFQACRTLERQVRNDCAATPTSRLVGDPGGRDRRQRLLGSPSAACWPRLLRRSDQRPPGL